MAGSMRTFVTDRQTDGRSRFHRTRRSAGRVQKKLVNKSQDNEFGDKSKLDTCQKWAQFGPQKIF